jgi:uncharacterized peroxidase-related enzyme
MAFIATVPVEQATGEVGTLYARSQARLGYVPNYAKLFSHRPQLWTAWENLVGSVRSNLDPRRYELITLAAARALRSSYCALAHGLILRKRFYSAPQLAAIMENSSTAQLAPADVAIMAFAEKVAREARAITSADVAALREHGLADAEIFDVAAAAAARCFFSTLLDALGAEPDRAYMQLEDELRQRLTVGRAIAASAVEQMSLADTSETGPRA